MIPDWAWIVWGLCSFCTYLVLVVVAMKASPYNDTMRENVRWLLGIYPPSQRRQIWGPALVALLAGFLAWYVPYTVLSIW